MKVAGANIMAGLKKKFGVSTQRGLSNRIGINVAAIQNWNKRTHITERQIIGLVHSAYTTGASNTQLSALRPIVEFFHLDRRRSKGGGKYELFSAKNETGEMVEYLNGLQKELKKHKGVYNFFDSRGHAIYAGKARRQTLWTEMKNAFNRSRNEVQTIKRVKHPIHKHEYLSSSEKARQIVDYSVPLHELAAYFSAYQVTDGLIEEIEAMLVRGFANDLLNQRMERFGQQKKAGKKSRR